MAEVTESGLPRVVAIAWGTQAQPQSGPRRGMSHERIIQRAVEIADENGLAAVTMQRLAESLGFTTMSLYRYVANKDELLMLMVGSEALIPGAPSEHPDWQVALREWAHSLRQMYVTHPWLLEVLRGPTSVLMPSSIQVVDQGLGIMAELPMDDRERLAVILAISSYASSFATLSLDLQRQDDLGEFGPEAMRELAEVITPERFPHAAPLVQSGGYVGGPAEDDPDDVDYEYSYGLDLIISGLAARLEGRTPG